MKWKDFLNPRSMLTPGIAGSVVMVIANTLWVEFMLPQKWSALILSFLVIVPILMNFAASFIENIIYFLFNGLIVFSLSVNTNFAGRKIQELTEQKNTSLAQLSWVFKTSNAVITSSVNHENTIRLASNSVQNITTKLNTQVVQEDNQDDTSIEKKRQRIEEKEKKLEKEKEKLKGKDRQFFQQWF